MAVRETWLNAAVDAINAAIEQGAGTIYVQTDIHAQLVRNSLNRTSDELLRSGRITVVVDTGIDDPYFEI